MKYAWYPGCKIPFFLEYYGRASEAVLRALGIYPEKTEFNCCGYYVRNLDFNSFLLSAVRNLALAEMKGLGIITPCKCCFGSLKHADYMVKNDRRLLENVNRSLALEGLQYKGVVEVDHFLTFLYHRIGLEKLKGKVIAPFSGIKAAAHYGCHALRPSEITGFDDPLTPTIFEQLIETTGAGSVLWPRRLDCCGAPQWETNRRLSLDLMDRKLSDVRVSGADFICTACTYCQMQFGTVQMEISRNDDTYELFPSVTYPQLLGLAMGLSEDVLELKENVFFPEEISLQTK